MEDYSRSINLAGMAFIGNLTMESGAERGFSLRFARHFSDISFFIGDAVDDLYGKCGVEGIFFSEMGGRKDEQSEVERICFEMNYPCDEMREEGYERYEFIGDLRRRGGMIEMEGTARNLSTQKESQVMKWVLRSQ